VNGVVDMLAATIRVDERAAQAEPAGALVAASTLQAGGEE
jgi:hypothetical protein